MLVWLSFLELYRNQGSFQLVFHQSPEYSPLSSQSWRQRSLGCGQWGVESIEEAHFSKGPQPSSACHFLSYSTRENLVTWFHLTARNAGKCDLAIFHPMQSIRNSAWYTINTYFFVVDDSIFLNVCFSSKIQGIL